MHTTQATRTGLNVHPLAYALTRMHPNLSAVIVDGENWDDLWARLAAASDILDDLLAEAGAKAVA